jgi:hypothetical protein
LPFFSQPVLPRTPGFWIKTLGCGEPTEPPQPQVHDREGEMPAFSTFFVPLSLWTTFASGDSAGGMTRCRVDSPLSVNVLLDNSVTVKNAVPRLADDVGERLATLAGLLRPGDSFRVYRLARSPEDTQVQVGSVLEIAAADPDARERDSAAIRGMVNDAYSQTAQSTDLAVSLQTVAEQVPPTLCARVVILVTDGALDPFETVSPDKAVRDVRAAVYTLRRQGFGVYALGLRAHVISAIDPEFRAKLQQSNITISYDDEGLQGDELLRKAFGAAAYHDFENAAVLDSLFFRGEGSIFRARLKLDWQNGLSQGQTVSYLVYEAPVDGGSDEYFTCGRELPERTPDSEEHIVVVPQPGMGRCYHYVRRPSLGLLRRFRGRLRAVGWSHETRIHLGAIPPVIRANDQIVAAVEDSTLVGRCAQDLWEAVRNGLWPPRQAPEETITVYFRRSGEEERVHDLALWPLPNQPRCFVPAAPWDTRLSGLHLTSASMRFEWKRGRTVEDIEPAVRDLDFSPVERGPRMRRVHAALFMPFNLDVWYLSGAVGLPPETQGGRLLVGHDFSRHLNKGADLTSCRDFAIMYGCWWFDGLYVGSVEPQAGRVVFGDADAAACESRQELPLGCRYISLSAGEMVPGGYGLLTPWPLLIGLFAVAAAIQRRRLLWFAWRTLIGRGMKKAWYAVAQPDRRVRRADSFTRTVTVLIHTGLIWAHLVFLIEAVFWTVRIIKDPSDTIGPSLGVDLAMGVLIGELGMALLLVYFRWLRDRYLTRAGQRA